MEFNGFLFVVVGVWREMVELWDSSETWVVMEGESSVLLEGMLII